MRMCMEIITFWYLVKRGNLYLHMANFTFLLLFEFQISFFLVLLADSHKQIKNNGRKKKEKKRLIGIGFTIPSKQTNITQYNPIKKI